MRRITKFRAGRNMYSTIIAGSMGSISDVRVDAFATYGFLVSGRKLTAQLNIKNLTNQRYYESTDEGANVASRLGTYPGAPITVIGGLRGEF